MKTRFLILICSLLIACHSEHSIKLGSYKSVKYSQIELGLLLVFKGIKGAYIGSEIILKKDSSFQYSTCGNILKGTWFTKNDSLILNVNSNRLKIDSLNVKGFNGFFSSIPKKPIKFIIENNYLISIHIFEKGKKIIEKLKFNVH